MTSSLNAGDAQADIDTAVAFVEARVEEMCRRYDDATLLGLARR